MKQTEHKTEGEALRPRNLVFQIKLKTKAFIILSDKIAFLKQFLLFNAKMIFNLSSNRF
jgi:hypothetical protein